MHEEKCIETQWDGRRRRADGEKVIHTYMCVCLCVYIYIHTYINMKEENKDIKHSTDMEADNCGDKRREAAP